MATKKVDETNEKVTAIDPYEMVTVKLPLTREKQDDVFVSLNGMTLLIQRGVEVEIPYWAKEILDNSETMDELALTRSRSAAKKFA